MFCGSGLWLLGNVELDNLFVEVLGNAICFVEMDCGYLANVELDNLLCGLIFPCDSEVTSASKCVVGGIWNRVW